MIVCAWGNSGRQAVGAKRFSKRVGEVVAMLGEERTQNKLFALGGSLTATDRPRHPLYLGKEPGFRPLQIRDGKLELAAESQSRPRWHRVRDWLRKLPHRL